MEDKVIIKTSQFSRELAEKIYWEIKESKDKESQQKKDKPA